MVTVVNLVRRARLIAIVSEAIDVDGLPEPQGIRFQGFGEPGAPGATPVMSLEFVSSADMQAWLSTLGCAVVSSQPGQRRGRPFIVYSAYGRLGGWSVYCRAVDLADAGPVSG